MNNNFSKSELDGLNLINKDMKNILSVGISTNGNAEIEMINRSNAVVTATTIDSNGIEKTRKKVKGKCLDDRIILKIEDVREQGIYEDNYFDYIYARLVLHYLTDKELRNVLKELKRVLKDNCYLYIVVRSDKCDEFNNGFINYDKDTGMTEHRTFTGNIEKRRFHSYESISRAIKESGLNIKEIKDYDEILYADYERTIPVDVRNNLIEVVCFK